MTIHQTIVWIDDQEACIFHEGEGPEPRSTVHAQGASGAVTGTSGSDLPATATGGYFHRVARAIDIADEILVVGPSNTKLEFVKYMHKDDHAIDPRILGIETIAHPSDGELASFAKLYFTVGGPKRSGNGSGHGTPARRDGR